jgi:hypothetical protein
LLFFFLTGVIILIFFERIRLAGLIGIGIGSFELYKFPHREKRWVAKKETEKKIDTNIFFEINEKGLKVKIDTSEKEDEDGFKSEITHNFSKMRACFISKTGILFKISFLEYYYISFKTIEKDYSIIAIIDFLKTHFKGKKLNIKYHGNS